MLIPEKITRRIDSCGRVSLPKNLRSKYGMNEGEELEFFTLYEGDKVYVCLALRDYDAEAKNDK